MDNNLNIPFQQAQFLLSVASVAQLPADIGSEVAFVGRSNVGKSSALNALTQQKQLARISKTPGRTRLINFFTLDDSQRRLVDLPGYGYAKVSKKMQAYWQAFLSDYLNQRKSLRGLILLSDIRHPMREFDEMMLDWATQQDKPTHVLLTKADKLGYGASKNQLLKTQQDLSSYDKATVQLFSALDKSGLDELKAKLTQWLK
jgi:GTP-binding protein